MLPTDTATHRVAADALRAFAAAVLERIGVPTAQADDAADVLVWANLRGVDTHGVRNLRRLYVDSIQNGRFRPAPELRIEHETPFSARVDGGGGLGLSAACWAMRLAMDKAEQAGIGLVAMRNSYHFGAAGYFPWMALQRDLIGVALTGRFAGQSLDGGVLPTFGARPMFSTNPISVAFPTQDEPPFLLDMATSIVPYNRIMMYNELGRTVPEGWGMTADHMPTTDPAVIRQLLPLGGTREFGSHKGYGLSMMVAVLCSVLSGGWSDLVPEGPAAFDGHAQDNDAHFFAALRVDAFRPVDEFKRGMDAMIRALHASPTEAGQERIYVPGEPEHDVLAQRQREGIPVPDNVLEDLTILAQEHHVPLPPFSENNQ